jgi:hypothetical protein
VGLAGGDKYFFESLAGEAALRTGEQKNPAVRPGFLVCDRCAGYFAT